MSRALRRKLSAAGVRFGPPGSKRLIYFVDDANMPLVDKYDTQSAIELIRQAVDYKGWYDKVGNLFTLKLLQSGFFSQEPSSWFESVGFTVKAKLAPIIYNLVCNIYTCL